MSAIHSSGSARYKQKGAQRKCQETIVTNAMHDSSLLSVTLFALSLSFACSFNDDSMRRRCFESDWGACMEKTAFRKFWSRIPQAAAAAAQAQILDSYELFMQAYDFYAAQVTTGSMEIGALPWQRFFVCATCHTWPRFLPRFDCLLANFQIGR
jgi:hypothetical protein